MMNHTLSDERLTAIAWADKSLVPKLGRSPTALHTRRSVLRRRVIPAGRVKFHPRVFVALRTNGSGTQLRRIRSAPELRNRNLASHEKMARNEVVLQL